MPEEPNEEIEAEPESPDPGAPVMQAVGESNPGSPDMQAVAGSASRQRRDHNFIVEDSEENP